MDFGVLEFTWFRPTPPTNLFLRTTCAVGPDLEERDEPVHTSYSGTTSVDGELVQHYFGIFKCSRCGSKHYGEVFVAPTFQNVVIDEMRGRITGVG